MTFYKWNTSGELTWSDGDALTSSDLDNSMDETIVPIGTVVGWIKSFTGVPATLPSGWNEADGTTLSDADSPMDGETLPDLNGDNRFLRGNSTSGGTGGSETHTHPIAADQADTDRTGGDVAEYGFASSTSATDATSTLPTYYEVVWIIRYK